MKFTDRDSTLLGCDAMQFCKYKYSSKTYCLHFRDMSEVLYTENGDNTFH